jgi:GntR family transcriptional repressor for pyruvate dehydrogenase complex
VGLTRSLKDSADVHREIYRAIRTRNSREAQRLMERHIQSAKDAQEDEKRMASRQRKSTKTPTNGKVAV